MYFYFLPIDFQAEMLKLNMFVTDKYASEVTSDIMSLDHQRAKSMESVPRIDRGDTSGQRRTRSISMTTISRPKVTEVDLKTGVMIPTPFRIYTEDV